MTEYNLFCYGEDKDEDGFQQPRYRAFNKEVGKERYDDIKALIRDDILKDLRLELNKSSWEDEWKKASKEQWLRMKNEVPEFDKEVVEKIIGFELDLDEKMITLSNGKKVSESTVKEALKEHTK